jgi:uncharacterized membrane protein YphA (DoxX/SURF4 family)
MGMYRDWSGDPRADPESDAMLAESLRVRERALRELAELTAAMKSAQPVAAELPQPIAARLPQPMAARLPQPTAVRLPQPAAVGLTQPTSQALTLGRILFSVLFIVAGASKLLDIATTVQLITDKVVTPGVLTTYTTQLEGMTGMSMAQMLAITAGALELICGLLIALNFGARFFAILLIIFVIVATFYFHDFWNQAGADQKNNMIHALKNLSIIGGLFIIAGIGRGPRANEPTYTDV